MAPPRQPPQSASSLSASRRPPGAPATFPRLSLIPCSCPGPWQSPYGPDPPCAGCLLPTAGLGSGRRGGAGPSSHAGAGEGTWGPNLPPRVVREDPAVTTLQSEGLEFGSTVGGLLSPFPVCVSTNKTRVVSMDETICRCSEPLPRPGPPISSQDVSVLPGLGLGYPLQNPVLRLGLGVGNPGGRQLGGRDVAGKSPAGGASEQGTPWAALLTSSAPGDPAGALRALT